MWVQDVLDEVALEGLDGITLSTLWTRLQKRPGFQFNVQEEGVRHYLWKAVLCNPSASSLSFFVLPAERPPLVWYDRFQHVSSAGMFVEDADSVPSAYPLSIVSGRAVRGSCKDIDHRQDITAQIYSLTTDLGDVMHRYGDRLIAVASQEDRNKVLGIYDVDPFMFISDRIYCFLELVGRCRHQGLATIGVDATLIGIDPKTAFYHRKHLLKKRLICKTHYHMIVKDRAHVTKGSLIYLSRFHKKNYSPIEQAAVKISALLAEELDQECEYVTLRDRIEESSRKIFAHVFANYASHFECFMKVMKQGKSTVKRKTVRLIKPVDLDVEDTEDTEGGEGDDDEELEEGSDLCDDSLAKARLFDPTRILADRTILSQCLMAIERSEKGLSQVEIGEQLSITKLDARQLSRLLERVGKVTVMKEEHGRTSISRYCSVNKMSAASALFEDARNGLQLEKSLDTIQKLKRANVIVSLLEQAEHHMVFGVYPFVKEIRASETGAGPSCDPKTVRRMLNKLQEEHKLRVHEFERSLAGKMQTLVVVTTPEVSNDDPTLKEKLDSWVFRLNNKASESQSKRISTKKRSARQAGKSEDGVYKYNPSIGKTKYGCQPKMRKIFTLYKFVFQQLHACFRKGMPVDSNDWRDSVTPIPGKNSRACCIKDLVPRIPVSIFCRIISITHEIPGLEELLRDPLRQNIPLNQASEVIARGLLLNRKYAYNILTLLTFMTGLGLVELENADAPDKDNVRVKVLSKLLFTHADETDIYTFTTVEDIEKCEEELAMHCESPCTGCSLPPNLFAHQSRNWYDGPRIKPSSFLPHRRGIYDGKEISETHELAINPFDDLVPAASRKQGQKRRKKAPAASPKKKVAISDVGSDAETAQPEMTPSKRKRKAALDDKDKYALSILNRRRCIWTQQEDNFLLLCRVATLLLGQENIMCINGKLARDELHRVIPISQNKTRNACQRRILYMLRDHRTRQNVLDWVSEFRQDDAFADIEIPLAPKTNEEVWNAAFMDTLSKVLDKFANPCDDRSATPLEMDESTLRKFELVDCVGGGGMIRAPVFVDPKNCVDIYVNTVENVLIASLILSHEGTRLDETYSYALFKIYQRYPDSLIRSVVAKLKKNTILALFKKGKKEDHSLLKTRGVTPYKLSKHYSFLMQTKFSMDTLVGSMDLHQPFRDTDERSDTVAIASLLTSRSAKFDLTVPEDFIALDKDNPFAKSPTKVPRDILISGDKRCSSRSVLYAFREQLSLNTKQPRDKIQDYLVLNKCTVVAESTFRDPLPENFRSALQTLLKNPVKRQASEPALTRGLINLIYSRKELGCTRSEIESSFVSFPSDVLAQLEESEAVYRVGVNCFRWVHPNFLGPWVVRTVSSKEPRAGRVEEKRQRRESQPDIEYIAKVWRRPSGDVDTDILYKFMAAIVGHVMTYPGISQASILSHFRICAPATQLLEILDLLLSAGCLSMAMILPRPKTRLFSPIDESACLFANVNDGKRLDDDCRAAERFFEVTANGILILSQVRGELVKRGQPKGKTVAIRDVSDG